MKLLSSLFIALSCAMPSLAVPEPPRYGAQWPYGPFTVDDRWVKDAFGNTVHFAGTNWPGHGEVMVPEGLQYRSVAQIVSQIKSSGMNAVRLTYAIEMIDQIYDNDGKDIDLETTFIQGLGQSNGTKVLQQVLKHNPRFTKKTTRLQATAELARRKIYILLDNHMSKAKWCCSGTDGNTWWNDREFDTA
ncbi:Beta-16-galactanase, partial [Fusarium albosuccineum]